MLTDYIAPEQRFVTCSNQDVAYGFGFASLDDEPALAMRKEIGNEKSQPALYLRRLLRSYRCLRVVESTFCDGFDSFRAHHLFNYLDPAPCRFPRRSTQG